jgi:GAF domain-containing protein
LLLHQDFASEGQGPVVGERRIPELISLGSPLSAILNTLCATIDWTIGSAVSLILLPNEQERDLHLIAQSAGDFGLHVFCSAAILSDRQDLLGTLQILCCDPRSPTANELQFIERVKHLAAIAIQSRHGVDDVDARRALNTMAFIN